MIRPRYCYTLITAIFAIYTFSACNNNNSTSNTISVSIEPLRYITEQIVGDDFQINVLVPPGASPETFEPKPTQMMQVANSQYYINIGLLDFEHNLQNAISKNMPNVKVVELKTGINLIEGDCGHDATEGVHDHNHGIDPHIWTTPKNLKIMARTVCDALTLQYPDSVKYIINYERFAKQLDSLDLQINSLFNNRAISFLIYHPALGYLASDYGLTQLSIEDEGKEPSAQHIRDLIQLTESKNIKYIFYQKQFSQSTVEALARESKIEALPIDPLAYDIPYNILEICKLIASQKPQNK